MVYLHHQEDHFLLVVLAAEVEFWVLGQKVLVGCWLGLVDYQRRQMVEEEARFYDRWMCLEHQRQPDALLEGHMMDNLVEQQIHQGHQGSLAVQMVSAGLEGVEGDLNGRKALEPERYG